VAELFYYLLYMENATSFGKQAAVYQKGRPGYPDALYDWVVQNSPNTDAVWDVGTGSGQAALALAERYARVYATDISEAQIEAAKAHPTISFSIAPAEQSGLSDNSVDAITVATAVHWFAEASFWEEVHRVAKPGALFCAWTYQLPHSTIDIEREFLHPVLNLIDPYWAEGNRVCMRGYTAEALNCPLPIISTPAFDAGAEWLPEQLVDFVRSWSAHFRAREDGLAETLAELEATFLSNHAGQILPISLPLSVIAARL